MIASRELTQTSVSQVEKVAEDQKGSCPRKWWFEGPMGLKPDQAASAAEGDAGHLLLATYLRGGGVPPKRSKMSKAVTGAIVKGDLPELGDDLLIEHRFDGQPKDSDTCECGHLVTAHSKTGCANGPECDCAVVRPQWLPLDVEKTFWLGGLPWEGFIDLTYRRGEIPTVLDHKFFSPADPRLSDDPHFFLKKRSELIQTVQLPIYVLAMARRWPDAKQFTIGHHCVSKAGVDSLIRSTVVTIDQALERAASIEKTVGLMRQLAPLTRQDDVPFNLKSCDAWSGCPHQAICSAFKKKGSTSAMSSELNAADDALFADLDLLADPAPASPPPTMTAEQVARAAANDAAVAADKAKAERVAKLRAELAAAEAPPAPAPIVAATPAPVARRMLIQDVETPPAPAPAAASVLSSDAPASKPEIASEKPPAPAAEKPPKAAAKPKAAAPSPTVNPEIAKLEIVRGADASQRENLAQLFTTIAALLRA